MNDIEKINQLRENKPFETQNVIEFLLWEIKSALQTVNEKALLIEKILRPTDE